MDHLPFPKHPLRPPILVPYLVRDAFNHTFDAIGLENYRDALGFDEPLTYNNYRETELNPFLQEYLFFGFLRSVLAVRGVDLCQDDFRRTLEDGSEVVTTEKLPLYSRRFCQAFYDRNLPWDEVVKERRHLNSLILRVNSDMQALKRSIQWSEADKVPTVQEALFISCTILRETLVVVVSLDLKVCKLTEFANPAFPRWLQTYMDRQLHRKLRAYDYTPADLRESASKDAMRVELIIELGAAMVDPTVPFLKSRIDAGNWCPSQLSGLSMPASIMYWLASARSGNEDDHSNCTGSLCKDWQIDENSYRTQHVPGCPGCEFTGPDPAELAAIVRQGHIPVVNVSSNIDGTGLTVHVLDSSKAPQYIAISHVWSHGLGNSQSNTLPTCQLQRIQSSCEDVVAKHSGGFEDVGIIRTGMAALYYSKSLASSHRAKDALKSKIGLQVLTHPTYFWMDTLCVPLRSKSPSVIPEDLRSKAIRNMARIYKCSFRVLVLESSLIYNDYDPFELSLRLNMSPWMKRLWTLQEAFMGSADISFQLYDRVATLREVIAPRLKEFNFLESLDLDRCWLRIGDPSDELWMTLELSPRVPVANPLNRVKGKERRKRVIMTNMLPLLAARSTSRPEDEAVCLATILDIDPQAILLKTGHQARMAELFSVIAKNDMDPVLIFTSGPRLDIDGYTWAPRHLIGRDASKVSVAGPPGHTRLVTCFQTSDGLCVTLPCWRITKPMTTNTYDNGFAEWHFMIRKDMVGRASPVSIGETNTESNSTMHRIATIDDYDFWSLSEISMDASKPGTFAPLSEAPGVHLGVIWLDPTGEHQYSQRCVMGILVYVIPSKAVQLADGRSFPRVIRVGRVEAKLENDLLETSEQMALLARLSTGEVSLATPDHLVEEWRKIYNDHTWIMY